jgi:hypothetical protein
VELEVGEDSWCDFFERWRRDVVRHDAILTADERRWDADWKG